MHQVFDGFDIDGGGQIETSELMKLGTARRTLGHKSSAWTPEKNQRMVTRMDKDGDGGVDRNEFVNYLDETLPRDPTEFNNTMDQFLEVALACGKEKKQKREEAAAKTNVAAHPCLAWPQFELLRSYLRSC